MPQPIVSTLAQRVYDYLKNQYGQMDESLGWPLLRWCTGYVGLIQDVADVVKTRNGKVGWTALVDPDQATLLTLPYVAQLYGVTLKKGVTEEQWRNQIKDKAGLYRGTPLALAGAIQNEFGVDTVFIYERDPDDYSFTVGVLNTEYLLPDESQLDALIAAEKPIGLIIMSLVRDPSDWDLFALGSTRYQRNADGFMEVTPSPYQTLADLQAHFTTLADLAANNPH
jgi:hypothetical protein